MFYHPDEEKQITEITDAITVFPTQDMRNENFKEQDSTVHYPTASMVNPITVYSQDKNTGKKSPTIPSALLNAG